MHNPFDATIAYESSNNSITLTGFDTPNYTGIPSWDWYQDHWIPATERRYITIISPAEYRSHIISSEDTYKKSFAVAKLLLEKNMLKSNKLRDFIELVEMIAKAYEHATV